MANWTVNRSGVHRAAIADFGNLEVRESTHRPKDGSPNPEPWGAAAFGERLGAFGDAGSARAACEARARARFNDGLADLEEASPGPAAA